jgi:excisionase family DNA binding protein
MNEVHISVDDAAKAFDVTKGTVWKWIRRYELPTFRILGDRRTFLLRTDVERLKQPIPMEEAKKLAA